MNILGTDYSFENNTEVLEEINSDGCCYQYEHKILVRKVEDMLFKDATDNAKKIRYCEVCRHEVIHGFFGEAGLEQYNGDEVLVTFLAVNFPKMVKIFKENGWLE